MVAVMAVVVATVVEMVEVVGLAMVEVVDREMVEEVAAARSRLRQPARQTTTGNAAAAFRPRRARSEADNSRREGGARVASRCAHIR